MIVQNASESYKQCLCQSNPRIIINQKIFNRMNVHIHVFIRFKTPRTINLICRLINNYHKNYQNLFTLVRHWDSYFNKYIKSIPDLKKIN